MANDLTINVNRAYQNAWIVYINGLEVPVSSVSITYGVWEIPQAEIVMVPDPAIQRLGAEDRVTVQCFYCDQWINSNKPEFRLLFDGEIVAWSYVNVNKQRTISFTAIDYIQIFTQIFFFLMSSVDDMAIGALGDQLGVNASGVQLAGFGALFPYSLFAQGLTQASQGADGSVALIKRPIDYVYNLIDGMISASVPNRSIPAANFFAPWARRTNFHKRFVALPMLEEGDAPGIFPILRAVQDEQTVSAVAQLTSNIGAAGSVWSVFQQVLSTLMMEIAMVPTAAAVLGEYSALNIMGPSIVTTDLNKPTFLTNYFVKPQFFFGLPPVCNVFYPSQISYFGYNEDYATQPTRMYFNAESWISYLNVKDASDALKETIRSALAVAHPEEVHQAMRNAITNPQHNGKNVLVYPEEFFRGPVIDRRPMPRWFMFLDKSQGKNFQGKDLSPAQEEQLAREVVPGDNERNIYRKYAAYEYTKERYSRRRGAVNMAFNPYPVPGFPCAIFDRRSSQVDVFGYIMNVRQTLSSRDMSTSISYSYGRTFQEAFALLHRQIDLENAVIERDRADTSRRVFDPTVKDPVMNMERVGAIAIAPAEPIREIRDVMQNFDRAEAFYKSLFFRARSPDADTLTQNQLQKQLVRNPNMVISSESETPISTSPSNAAQIAQDLNNKTASFQYHRIIQFITENGEKEGIQLSGIDTTTRLRIVSILDKMRAGTATEAEIELVRSSLNRPDLLQSASAEEDSLMSGDLDSSIIKQINNAEEYVQNMMTTTNLRGDKNIEPTDAGKPYFDNYESAMLYNARPICTLDEYIQFLGEHAVTEGKVLPNKALASDDLRTFPAVYYRRIRRYRPGPPDLLPTANYTNSAVLTSPDGVCVVPVETPAPTMSTPVETVETIESIEAPAPTMSTAAETTAATPAVPQATPNPSSATIQAIPENFPEVTQDWDVMLQAYRSNVLAKLAPGR